MPKIWKIAPGRSHSSLVGLDDWFFLELRLKACARCWPPLRLVTKGGKNDEENCGSRNGFAYGREP
jgi:hypothetical protein